MFSVWRPNLTGGCYSSAISCGLIINELVSNALKYAFPDGRVGAIQVVFQKNDDDTLTLSVRDNGIGLPSDFDTRQAETLGITLVRGLVTQIRGTLEINGDQGTMVKIVFGG